jgi:integrase
MGTIYRPKYTDRHDVVQEAAVWWVRYRQHGKTVRQSTETTSEAKARAFLREREGKVALNIPVNVKPDRLTLSDAAELIRHDYTANGHKSADTLELRLTHLLAHFGAATRLSRITTGSVEQYKAARLAEPVTLPATKTPRVDPPARPPKLTSPATVNRELAILARMGSLARRQYGLAVPFVVEKLRERNAREGFFEDAAFRAVCRLLRPELAALATVGQLTGWRKSELRSRQVAPRRLRRGLAAPGARGDEESRGAACSPSYLSCARSWRPSAPAWKPDSGRRGRSCRGSQVQVLHRPPFKTRG